MVALELVKNAPVLLRRERIELANANMGGSQPYHAAKSMSPRDASIFLDRCIGAVNDAARDAVENAISHLRDDGYYVPAACVLLGSGRPLGDDLTKVLASHLLIHTAEGVLYRAALKTACEASGLSVLTVPERDLAKRAAAELRLSPAQLQRQVAELGASAGPPWQEDQKLSLLASWICLHQTGPCENCLMS